MIYTFEVTVPNHVWMGTIMGDNAANAKDDVGVTRDIVEKAIKFSNRTILTINVLKI